MAEKNRRGGSGLAVLAALGVACIAAGVLTLWAGAGARVFRNRYGQLDMLAFLIPVGVVLLAVAVIAPLDRLRRYLVLRWYVRQYRRRTGPR